jgi:chromosome segregation ATPase
MHEQLHVARANTISALGKYQSAAELEQAYIDTVARVRTSEFIVHTLRREEISLSKSITARSAQERASQDRVKFLTEALSQLENRMLQLEATLSDLSAEHDRLTVSDSSLEAATAAYAESCAEIVELERVMAEFEADNSSESLATLKANARPRVEELISILTFFERKQADVCERKFSALADVIDREENRLRYLTLQRELRVLRGQDSMDMSVDFESGDIDRQKRRLKDLHEDVQQSEQKRMQLADRIEELKEELERMRGLN